MTPLKILIGDDGFASGMVKMKNIILYVEDDGFIRREAKSQLRQAFTGYQVETARCTDEVDELMGMDVVSLENIAIVCTDGSLLEDSTGWEVVERLRAKGYNGPALYTGTTELPAEKEHLYSGKSSKLGANLLESVQKYLSNQT